MQRRWMRGRAGWKVIGGTSAASPAWAAMVALANQASIKAGGFLEGFLNPALYDIAHGSSGTSYVDAFHDVVPVHAGALQGGQNAQLQQPLPHLRRPVGEEFGVHVTQYMVMQGSWQQLIRRPGGGICGRRKKFVERRPPA